MVQMGENKTKLLTLSDNTRMFDLSSIHFASLPSFPQPFKILFSCKNIFGKYSLLRQFENYPVSLKVLVNVVNGHQFYVTLNFETLKTSIKNHQHLPKVLLQAKNLVGKE